MRITNGDIVLRDYEESDIEDEVRWLTKDNDWISLDTPWEENEDQDADEIRDDMRGYFRMSVRTPESIFRPRLEIEVEGRHIGFVSSYFLDQDYEETEYDAFGFSEGRKYALGIEICEKEYRNRGFGKKALELYMEYHRTKKGIKTVALETHSGNEAMLALASSLGFHEVKRRKGAYKAGKSMLDRIVLVKSLD